MELKGKKINFLGDSITEGHGTSAPEHIYWQVLGRRTGAIVRGYGIGGTRIAPQHMPEEAGCEIYSRYFGSRVAEMDPDADVIVVFGGTNDYGHGDAPLGCIHDRQETTFYGALHCLCRKLWETYPAAEIVLMTPLHRLGECELFNGKGVRNTATLSDYVQAIREVAEYYALPVLDLYTCGGMNPEVPVIQEMYMPDGLHPNDTGHARIASRLEGFLKTL